MAFVTEGLDPGHLLRISAYSTVATVYMQVPSDRQVVFINVPLRYYERDTFIPDSKRTGAIKYRATLVGFTCEMHRLGTNAAWALMPAP